MIPTKAARPGVSKLAPATENCGTKAICPARKKSATKASSPPHDSWALWDLVTTAVAAALTVASTVIPMAAAEPSLPPGAAAGEAVTMATTTHPPLTAPPVYSTPAASSFGEYAATSMYELLLNTTMATGMELWNSTRGDVAPPLPPATETPYVPYKKRPETYIVPVLFSFIFLVGVVGNGTLIVVFFCVRQMRNVPNTYILSLALADILVILTTVPLTSTVYTVDSWPYGSFLCTLSEFIKDVSIGVSVFTLTALSADRYFAIVDPLRKFHAHGGGKRATRMTIAIAISIWLLAIVCGLPAAHFTNLKRFEVNSKKSFLTCYPFPDEYGRDYAKVMVMLRFLVYYAIPLLIIGVFYVLIARHLMYAANVPGEMQGAVRQVRARRKVAVTVLAFVVIFGICFLPYHVWMLWFYYWPTSEADYNSFWHVLRIVGFCLSFANSCANPVALYFVSGAFRKHFNRYLFCQNATGRHTNRHDTLCMHRDTSLTSTASKRYYSRRSCNHQSTIRSSRLAETSITVLPSIGNHNGGGVAASEPLTSDYYHNQEASAPGQQKRFQLI